MVSGVGSVYVVFLNPLDRSSYSFVVERFACDYSKMASPLGLPPPEPLKILDGNTSLKWKKFKRKWTNYEIATGVSEKEDATRVATFLTEIGEEAVDVYNTFNWATEGDNL